MLPRTTGRHGCDSVVGACRFSRRRVQLQSVWQRGQRYHSSDGCLIRGSADLDIFTAANGIIPSGRIAATVIPRESPSRGITSGWPTIRGVESKNVVTTAASGDDGNARNGVDLHPRTMAGALHIHSDYTDMRTDGRDFYRALVAHTPRVGI
jgi:hypothetical protein